LIFDLANVNIIGERWIGSVTGSFYIFEGKNFQNKTEKMIVIVPVRKVIDRKI